MPKATLWKLDPHTLGKHKVLRGYLDAWLPIMSRWNGRVLFIDGFAGPGEYLDGEEGSPIIALKAYLEHQARNKFKGEVGFVFIEKEADRVEHLTELVESLKKRMPEKSQVQIIHGAFDETLVEALDTLDTQAQNLAPALVMVDPFGVSDTPMSVIERILRSPKSEVYISFMYEFINRFAGTPEFEDHMDRLFGASVWREGLDIGDGQVKKEFFYALYEKQLRAAGAQQVIHFELFEGGRLVYAIFFATKHHLGCDRMKQAIWRVAPWGDYAFRPVKGPQMTLGIESPDFGIFQTQIHEEYKGQGWVDIATAMEFAMSDQTPFHSSHLKRNALVPLEDEGKIEIKEGTRKRRRTFPDGTFFRVVS